MTLTSLPSHAHPGEYAAQTAPGAGKQLPAAVQASAARKPQIIPPPHCASVEQLPPRAPSPGAPLLPLEAPELLPLPLPELEPLLAPDPLPLLLLAPPPPDPLPPLVPLLPPAPLLAAPSPPPSSPPLPVVAPPQATTVAARRTPQDVRLTGIMIPHRPRARCRV